jgi:hypothetical protein
MTQVVMSKSPSPAGGPVVVTPPRPGNNLNIDSAKKQQSKGGGKGYWTPRKNGHRNKQNANEDNSLGEPTTPTKLTKIALATSVGSPQVLKEGTAENQAWTASLNSLNTPTNFYMDPYAQTWGATVAATEVDTIMPENAWSGGIPPWPEAFTSTPSVFQGLDLQDGMQNGSLQIGLRPDAAEFNPDAQVDVQDSPWNDRSVGLRPEAAEFVPPIGNGAMDTATSAEASIRVDGLDPRKALLTLCGAWGALAGEETNAKGAIKVWEDDGPRMSKSALLRCFEMMKEQDDLDPPEGIGFRTKKRKKR